MLCLSGDERPTRWVVSGSATCTFLWLDDPIFVSIYVAYCSWSHLCTVIVVTLYLPNSLARRQWRNLLVFESSCHLSTTLGGGFTLSLLMLNSFLPFYSKEAVNTRFYSPWFDRPGFEPESTASVADALFTRPCSFVKVGVNHISGSQQHL